LRAPEPAARPRVPAHRRLAAALALDAEPPAGKHRPIVARQVQETMPPVDHPVEDPSPAPLQSDARPHRDRRREPAPELEAHRDVLAVHDELQVLQVPREAPPPGEVAPPIAVEPDTRGP